ncbi:MAG: ribosome maturation factor RimM [Bacteroidales bacterium]
MLCFNSKKVGYVKKTHGTKGQVIVEFDFPLPKNFKLNEWVFLKYQGTLIPFMVEWYQIIDEKSIFLKFIDFDTILSVKRFVASLFFVEKTLPWIEKIEPIYLDIKGYKLFNNKTFLGIIDEQMPIKNNPIVQITDMENKKLIPFQAQFIKEIDHNNKTVILSLPPNMF